MISEDRTYKGFWWSPRAPKIQVAGTLMIGSHGDIKLELLGCFEENEHELAVVRKDESVIFGRCYDPKLNMTDISLWSCRASYTLNFSSSYPITRYSCRYALVGIHLDSVESKAFFKANVDFKELAYWCPPTNINTTISNNEVSLTLKTATDEETVKAHVSLDEETALFLKESVSYVTDYPFVNIVQSTYLEISKEEISAKQLLAIINGFERFLTVALLKPVEHEKILLFSRLKNQDFGNGEVYYHQIEFVTHLYKADVDEKEKTYNYLFQYKDVAKEFGDMFRKLYLNKEIAQILSNFIDSLEKKRVFTSNDFLVIIQALDGFSIRFRKEDDFLPQLTALRDEFQNIRKLILTDNDLRAAKSSRHYYSHLLKLDNKNKEDALEGFELYKLTTKLRILLICCLLNFMGFGNDKINQFFNKSNNPKLHIT